MCDPLTAGSAAVGAGGTLLNAIEGNSAQKRAIEARNAATLAELQRQRAFQAQSGTEFDNAVGGFSPENQAQKLTDAQTSATQAFQGNAPTAAMVGSIGSTTAPRVVGDSEAKRIADVFGKIATNNSNLGTLTGYDQRAFGNNLDLNQSGRNLNLISDKAKTSAAVAGMEQNAAYNNAIRPPSGLGSILQFAGNVGAFNAGKGGSLSSLFAPRSALYTMPMDI